MNELTNIAPRKDAMNVEGNNILILSINPYIHEVCQANLI